MSILSPRRVLAPWHVNTQHIPNDLRLKELCFFLHFTKQEKKRTKRIENAPFSYNINTYSLSIHFEWPLINFTQINFLTSVQFALLERYKIKLSSVKQLKIDVRILLTRA
jgi:hypothetical protein